MALTKRRVDSFNYDGRGRDIRWDGEGGLPGFGLRIYPSGKKVFVLVYRRPGQRKQRLKTIGPYGVLTLDGARQRARKLLVEIGDGADPTSTAPNQTQTLKDFTAIYLRDHAKPFKKSWKEDERRINKHVVPELGSMLLIDTRRSDLVRLHQKIGKKAPYEANQILALIGSIFAKAEEWGYVPEGHPNPSRGVQKFQERSRDRWLRPEEVVRLFKAVGQEQDPFVRAAVLVYLLTGLRKGELLSIRWSDVDFERRELHLPNTKSGRSHSVPLSSPAVALLRQLPRQEGSPWVFPGKGDRPRADIKVPWVRIRKAAGLEDIRLHDLRRTVGSWMAQAGVPLQVIGQVLNHTRPEVTRIYARLAENQSREALDMFAEKFVETVGIPVVEVGTLTEGSGDVT